MRFELTVTVGPTVLQTAVPPREPLLHESVVHYLAENVNTFVYLNSFRGLIELKPA